MDAWAELQRRARDENDCVIELWQQKVARGAKIEDLVAYLAERELGSITSIMIVQRVGKLGLREAREAYELHPEVVRKAAIAVCRRMLMSGVDKQETRRQMHLSGYSDEQIDEALSVCQGYS